MNTRLFACLSVLFFGLWIVFLSLYIHERKQSRAAKLEAQTNSSNGNQSDNKLFVIKYNVLPDTHEQDWNDTRVQYMKRMRCKVQSNSKAGVDDQGLTNHLDLRDTSGNFYTYALRKRGIQSALDRNEGMESFRSLATCKPLVCFVTMVENVEDVYDEQRGSCYSDMLRKLKPFGGIVEHLTIISERKRQKDALTHFFIHHGLEITAHYVALVTMNMSIENNHVMYDFQSDTTGKSTHGMIVWNKINLTSNTIHTNDISNLSFHQLSNLFGLEDTWVKLDIVREAAEKYSLITVESCLSLMTTKDLVHFDFVLYNLNGSSGFVLEEEYVTCNLKGGLGNQLFQVAAVIEYGKKFGKKPVFDTRKLYLQETKDETRRQTYFESVLSWCSDGSVSSLDLGLWSCLVETGFEFEELPHLPGNVIIDGYFQSSQYSPQTIQDTCNKIIQHITSQTTISHASTTSLIRDIRDSSNVSIHIRRSDYVQSSVHVSLPISYYRNSLSKLIDVLGQKKCSSLKLVFFSDDVQWCRSFSRKRSPFSTIMKYFDGYQIVDTSELVDAHVSSWLDMYLMSLCTHHIIANSTYSWWAAKLDQCQTIDQSQLKGLTIAPRSWFNPIHIAEWETIYDRQFIIV